MEDSARALVDVVIVNYRSYDELTHCLASLQPARGSLASVTVVDHDSDAASAASVASQFPWINLIGQSTNEGFAKGVNLGTASAGAGFVLLLNPDCVADAAAIDQLLSYALTCPDAGVVAPRILNADGTIQGSARRFPGLSTFVAGRSSWLTRRFPRNPLSRWNLPALSDPPAPMEVDWVSGACMLVRRSAFEQVGRMDERFFLYWEDADLCKRLWQQGWRVVYFPAAAIVHAGGRSSIHAYRESLLAFHASAFMLFRKHATWPSRWLAPLVFLALRLRLRSMLSVDRGRSRSTRLPDSSQPT